MQAPQQSAPRLVSLPADLPSAAALQIVLKAAMESVLQPGPPAPYCSNDEYIEALEALFLVQSHALEAREGLQGALLAAVPADRLAALANVGDGLENLLSLMEAGHRQEGNAFIYARTVSSTVIGCHAWEFPILILNRAEARRNESTALI